MLPEKLCHVENIAPGTAASGNIAKCVAASDVARPELLAAMSDDVLRNMPVALFIVQQILI